MVNPTRSMAKFFIGSADWMHRNLSKRVEAVAPVTDRAARAQLWEILEATLNDSRQAWQLGADGDYVQAQPSKRAAGVAKMGTHAWLMKQTLERAG